MSHSLVMRRFLALAGVVGLAGCSGSPMSSVSPTAASATAAGSGVVHTMPETDPCATLVSINRVGTQTDVPPPECEPVSGRFTGGGFQIDEFGVRVTRGFTLHCDAILSNNFEVNWDGGNQFHIDKNPTDVVCTRNAAPNPPDADANRIEIVGTGRLNGVPGATIHLVLEDHGEPGRDDRAYISINGGAALVVGGSSAAPDLIDGGNIQAHFDQPHKK